jgi:8-oxo-dGTP diphosphatase
MKNTNAKTEYVVGFIFRAEFTEVLLMTKMRPIFQRGKLNGTGGHVEDGELPEVTMAREAYEEVNFQSKPHEWHPVGQINAPSGNVIYFYSIYIESEKDLYAKTDEPIDWYEVRNLPENILSSQTYMIPHAILELQRPESQGFMTIEGGTDNC